MLHDAMEVDENDTINNIKHKNDHDIQPVPLEVQSISNQASGDHMQKFDAEAASMKFPAMDVENNYEMICLAGNLKKIAQKVSVLLRKVLKEILLIDAKESSVSRRHLQLNMMMLNFLATIC